MSVFGLGPTEFVIILVILLFVVALPIWMLRKIFGRAGLSKGYALLFFVPYVGPLVVLAILAFSRWPAVDELIMARGAPGAQVPAVPSPPAAPAAASFAAAWLPDPTGGHRLRYWDGNAWTTSIDDS